MIGQFSLFDIAPSIEGIDPRKAKASYSADLIATNGTVRKPAQHGGSLWVSVGSAGAAVGNITAELYRLVPLREFDGETLTYSEKSGYWREGDKYPGDFARSDPNGFYHGMRVKHGGQSYVLAGPEQVLRGSGADFYDFDDAGRTRIGNTPDEDEDEEEEEEEEDETGTGLQCEDCGADCAPGEPCPECGEGEDGEEEEDCSPYCVACDVAHVKGCPTCAEWSAA